MKTVAITRPRDLLLDEAGSGGAVRPALPPSGPVRAMAELVRSEGFLPLWYPLTRLVPHADLGELDRRLGPEQRDLLLLTSRRVAPLLVDTLGQGRARSLAREVWCVGPGTAEAARRWGFQVDRVAARHVAEGLLDEFGPSAELEGRTILLPRSARGRRLLPEALAGRGARVDEFHIYSTEAEEGTADALLEDMRGGRIDWVALTAGSGARALAGAWRRRGRGSLGAASLVAMGPAAADAARGEGLPVAGVASVHSLDGIVAAIRDLDTTRKGGE